MNSLIDHCGVLHQDVEINGGLINDLQAEDDTDFRRPGGQLRRGQEVCAGRESVQPRA